MDNFRVLVLSAVASDTVEVTSHVSKQIVERARAADEVDVRRWIRLYGSAWSRAGSGLVTVTFGVDPIHGGVVPDDFSAEVICFAHGGTEVGAIFAGDLYGRPIDSVTWTVRFVTNYVGGYVRIVPEHPYMGTIEVPIAEDPHTPPYAIPGPDPAYPQGGNA